MENQYSQERVDKIKGYIREHGYAPNWEEPTLYLTTTYFLFFGTLYAIHVTKQYNIALILLLSCILLRLFMIFHDTCHRSYFPTDEREKNYKGFNFWAASIMETWCGYSAEYWNTGHSRHHSAHGNMNEYDGTRTVLTSDEYNSLDTWKQNVYDIVRFPPLFFLILPIYVFWIARIINFDISYIVKYIAWLAVLYIVGSWKLLISYVIAQYITCTVGVMLFHLQHQVNVGYWKPFDKEDRLSKENAELVGASVLEIPSFLEFFTNGIEYHNVHHIDPGVPCYNTKKVYYELVNQGWIQDNKIGFRQQLSSLGHTMFNQTTNRYE
jgi:omega-6 fatty acid desaturase (delta-12 desaturase)